ncbi:unnamed protein product [Phytomonas sp. EM1]|nr:unnamed protein product [Phytomonas sp. EM1]|eukprot:CCW60708.1 unnamed protein product [Phytomonas sp. isolate EM1]
MPFNRELLASITFEPSDTSEFDEDDLKPPSLTFDASVSDGNQPKNKDTERSSTEKQEPNEATKLFIRCLKIALEPSLVSISHPEKQRPLNSKRDFSIEVTTNFYREKYGFTFCGGDLGKVKKKHELSRNFINPHRVITTKVRTTLDDMLDDTYESSNLEWTESKSRNSWSGPLLASDSAEKRTRSSMRLESSDDSDGDDDIPPVDFKFVDYSPMCYRHIREFFGINSEKFCNVLCNSRWHSIPTPGKSAAQLFFCGRDWVIKTMTRRESNFLRKILHRYYYHVRDNPFTLLPHFVGHYHLEVGKKSYSLIVMQNVFATTNPIHEKFDLKGSTIGRFASDAEKMRATCTQKDLDIHNPIHIGAERRRLLIEQLKKDCDFLKYSNIMDYSLLLGIHILPPTGRPVGSGPAPVYGGLGTSRKSSFLEHSSSAVDGRCFTADEGGILSNEVLGLRQEIYYLGIIDILQEYDVSKQIETMAKGLIHDSKRISCITPFAYASRFFSFISSMIV